MNSEWQNFLKTQGAELAANGVARFPQPASDDCVLFDLSHLGLVALEGADVDDFLQGQLTNDIRELTEAHSQLSSHCSAKGRMLASFRMIRRAGVVYMQMPSETMPIVLKRLGMFKLRAQVELTDASDRLMCIGLAGACAADLLHGATGQPPGLENGVVHHGDITLVRMPGGIPRFEILGPAAALRDLWTRLAADGAAPANTERWNLLDIQAGVPTVYASTVEAFVPQMANMQLVDGVSFTKGCYTGQEVVARMQYLGKLKRRMYLAEVATDRCPAPGDELFAGASESGQGAGKVVGASATGDGHCELLAVVEIAAVDEGDVRLGEGGPKLEFRDLPYGFTESQAASG